MSTYHASKTRGLGVCYLIENKIKSRRFVLALIYNLTKLTA